MECNIYVINMEKSTDRRENVESQMRNLGLSFTFFEAVNGNENKHFLFDRYNEEKRQRVRGKSLVGGQLGCFASHHLLWEKCVADNKPMIVLEDDVVFYADTFLSFYNNISNVDAQYSCIRMFKNKSKKNRHIVLESLGQISIAKFSKGHMSTTGYYITPKAAELFLMGAKEWVFPVDIYMDRFWSNKVECYGVVPPCIDNDKKFDSDINYKGASKYSFAVKARRELFAFSESIRRALWNLKFKVKFFLSRGKR